MAANLTVAEVQAMMTGRIHPKDLLARVENLYQAGVLPVVVVATIPIGVAQQLGGRQPGS